MTDSADFTLRLRDETSKPAANAKKSVEQLAAALRAASTDARATERAWQRALTNRRALTPSPPRIDRSLSVDFQRRALERHRAVGFARRQAQIQDAGGLSRIAQLEGTGATGAAAMAGTFGGTAGAVLGLTAGAAAAAAAGVALLTAKFAGATASALDFGQRSKLAFSSLLGDTAMGAAEFELTRREAQKLGLDVRATTDSFRDLLAAQFKTGEAHELIRASADLKAIGADAERVKLALLALTQIKMKGVLQAEEMRQLVNTGVSAELIYNNLAKRLGKTRAEILKMQQARQITAEDAIEAFKEAIKEKTHETALGDTATKFANSKISGMLSQVRAQIENAFITLGERLEPAATRLAKLAFGTFEKLAQSPAFQRFSDTLVGAFEAAAAYLEANWPKIERFIIGGVETMVNAVTSAIQFTREHWDDIVTAMKGAAGIAVVLAGAFAVAGASVLLMLSPILALTGAVVYLTGKMVEGSAELGKWLRIAGAIASLVPGVSGGALTALGMAFDRGGTAQTTEDQIREESRARMAGVNAASQAGRVLGGGGSSNDNSRKIGSITIPTQFSALDPDDLEGVHAKWDGMVRRSVQRIFEEA